MSNYMNYNNSHHGYHHDRSRSNVYSQSRNHGGFQYHHTSSAPLPTTSQSSYSSSSSMRKYNSDYKKEETTSSRNSTTTGKNSQAEKKKAISPEMENIIQDIMLKLKSKGIFDRFRKECMADVDTKPAYINLNSRVKHSVDSFLKKLKWTPNIPKVKIRETIRKNVSDPRHFDSGIDRIVDQVVNPKISSIFFPMIEEEVYNSLGMEKPKEVEDHVEDQVVNMEIDESSPDCSEVMDTSVGAADANGLETRDEVEKDHSIKSSNEREEILGSSVKQHCNSEDEEESVENMEAYIGGTPQEESSDENQGDDTDPEEEAEDEEEEESPPFEKIGESPPPSPKKSEDVNGVEEEQDEDFILYDKAECGNPVIMIKRLEASELPNNSFPSQYDEDSKESSEVSPSEDEANCISEPIKKWTIPEDVEDTPVYFLEPIPSLAEKSKFYLQFRDNDEQ